MTEEMVKFIDGEEEEQEEEEEGEATEGEDMPAEGGEEAAPEEM